MKQSFKNVPLRICRTFVALVFVLSIVHIIPLTARAITVTYNHYMASLEETEYYGENDPIDRVYEVKTGSSSKSRKITFEQTEGSISYYMYRNTTKTCKGSYEILAYNENTKKAKTYDWEWTNKKTITLDKNTAYTIIIYPADFDTVCQKYLTNKILNTRPIIYGYNSTPCYTVSSAAPTFSYRGQLAELTAD